MNIRYDFSDDGAGLEYILMEDKLKKFFVYMASSICYSHENEDIMKWGADFCQEIKSKQLNISDPDSNSKLLQEIYGILWDESSLIKCRKNNGEISGDTMNSANTTLDQWYKMVETEEQKKERAEVKEVKRQGISIRYILSRYVKDPVGLSELFDTVEGMKLFLSIYHTLGNFIPIPKACNKPRERKVKDYWDLTLKAIYDYYVCDENSRKYKIYTLEDVVGEDKSKLYKDWLDSFSDDNSKEGSNKWNDFVEKNYMQDFVNLNADGSYGMPKELWKGHFAGKVLPEGKQIEQFFVNASCCITARSIRMYERLTKSSFLFSD